MVGVGDFKNEGNIKTRLIIKPLKHEAINNMFMYNHDKCALIAALSEQAELGQEKARRLWHLSFGFSAYKERPREPRYKERPGSIAVKLTTCGEGVGVFLLVPHQRHAF